MKTTSIAVLVLMLVVSGADCPGTLGLPSIADSPDGDYRIVWLDMTGLRFCLTVVDGRVTTVNGGCTGQPVGVDSQFFLASAGSVMIDVEYTSNDGDPNQTISFIGSIHPDGYYVGTVEVPWILNESAPAAFGRD